MAELRLAKSLSLTQFGVNHVSGSNRERPSLRHWHIAEDEFIYVLEGTWTLIDDNGPHELTPGMFAAFPAGERNGRHIQNCSDQPGIFRLPAHAGLGGETIHYPDDDFGPIQAEFVCRAETDLRAAWRVDDVAGWTSPQAVPRPTVELDAYSTTTIPARRRHGLGANRLTSAIPLTVRPCRLLVELPRFLDPQIDK